MQQETNKAKTLQNKQTKLDSVIRRILQITARSWFGKKQENQAQEKMPDHKK